MDWNKISFILKSEKRRELLLLLRIPKTPSQLSKLMHTSLPNVSSKLNGLQSQGLIECVNPGEKKGRIYRITENGKNVLKAIEEMEKPI